MEPTDPEVPMTLAERATIAVALPHRSIEPIDVSLVAPVARQAEALGFADLWVTENTLDTHHCLDPVAALAYAAGVTSRIRLGVSVVVLPVQHPARVAHQYATLDLLSGGRTILGVGLGREQHFEAFGVSSERRVRRFLEATELIRELWERPHVSYDGEVIAFDGGFGLRPVSPQLWFGGMHPAALRRAARRADGWMAAGQSGQEAFAGTARTLRQELEDAGRDPAAYPVSKRVFLAVDDDPTVAERTLRHWFGEIYRNPGLGETSGVSGTADQVAEQLHDLVEAGANHLLLNPVVDFPAQVEVLAGLSGLTPPTRPAER